MATLDTRDVGAALAFVGAALAFIGAALALIGADFRS
jgi:hypothetical protein